MLKTKDGLEIKLDRSGLVTYLAAEMTNRTYVVH